MSVAFPTHYGRCLKNSDSVKIWMIYILMAHARNTYTHLANFVLSVAVMDASH